MPGEPDQARSRKYQLRLYVAGQSARSIAAISRLGRICDVLFGGRYAIEVIDLLEQPRLAKDDDILAIPTLARRLPLPVWKIISDLSSVDQVLLRLDIVNLEGRA